MAVIESYLRSSFFPEGWNINHPADFKVGLASLFDRHTSTDTRVGILGELSRGVFSSENHLNQNLVGSFLATAVEINRTDSPAELKQAVKEILAPALLDQLTVQSSREGWTLENVQPLMNAATELHTMEEVLGSEVARQTKMEIARNMVEAETYDAECGRLMMRGSGGTIFLSPDGTAVPDLSVLAAVEQVADKQRVKEHIAGYYRAENYWVDPRMDHGGENRGRETRKEHMAALKGRKSSPRGPGVELATGGGTVDDDGEIRVALGTGQVAGQMNPAAGWATKLRMDAIKEERIVFDRPERTDKFRQIKLKGNTDFVVLIFGDGAAGAQLDAVCKEAGIMKSPLGLVCNDNQWAIGTQGPEVYPDVDMIATGHASGIPGKTFQSTDIDGIFLGARFMATRASSDGGATFLHIMTERLAPHSSSHGHPAVGDAVRKLQEMLSPLLDSKYAEVSGPTRQFLENDIFVTTQTSPLPTLRNKAAEYMRLMEGKFEDPSIELALKKFIDGIIDPSQVILKRFIDEGVVPEDLVNAWIRQGSLEARQIAEEVLAEPGPNPEEMVGKHIRMKDPQIMIRGANPTSFDDYMVEVRDSDESITMTGAQATAFPFIEAAEMNDRGWALWGIDTNVGYEVRDKAAKPKGGYFGEFTGVFQAAGHWPGVVRNTLINERAVMEQLFGAATEPVGKIEPDFQRQLALIRGIKDYPQHRGNTIFRPFGNLAYVDYGFEGVAAWLINAGVVQTTSGKFIRPAHGMMHEGNTPGGGPPHSHNGEGFFLQMPEGLDVLSVSSPDEMRQLLRYQLRFSTNPSVILWDRSMFNREQTWRKGADFFVPGQDKILREGEDLQVITYGPETKTVEATVAELDKRFKVPDIGVYKWISMRPNNFNRLFGFISRGTGPIVIATEETQSHSAGNQLREVLDSPRFKPFTKGREIIHVASPNHSHPYNAGELVNAQRPGVDKLADSFLAVYPFMKLEPVEDKYFGALFDNPTGYLQATAPQQP